MTKPKIITLCGSSKFCDIMAVCAWLLERDEKVITMGLHLLPLWYPNIPKHHLAEHEGVSDEMDTLHLRKIDLSDEVFVVHYDHYIGKSTGREIDYAMDKQLPIRWFTDEPIGKQVQKMIDNFLKRSNKKQSY